jgi:cyanophycin synthetase
MAEQRDGRAGAERGAGGRGAAVAALRVRDLVRDVRALAGPSLWRPGPAVVCEVTPEPLARRTAATPDECLARLGVRLPPPAGTVDAADGPSDTLAAWPAALARLALELERRSGSEVAWARVTAGGDPGAWDVAVEYEEAGVGEESVRAAAALLIAAAAGEPADVAAEVAALGACYEREHLGATASVLVAEARRRGIPVRREPGDAVVQLGLGCRLHRIDATLTDLTGVIATDITSDKDRTKRVLARLGVPVPRGGVATTADEAVDIAEDVGFPVLVKPLAANNGRGTSPRLDSMEAVRAAFARARAEHPTVVVERFAEGRDHRVLVVAGRVVAVAERVPAHVVGDGARTVRELAEGANRDPLRSEADPRAPLAPIPLDGVTTEYLARSGRTLETVPAAGEAVYLRSTANISTGGTSVDRTDEIHPDNAAVCAFAADAVGLDVAGIDVLTPDVSVPFRENGAVVIEVNASPGIRMHTDPQRGPPRDVPGAVLDMLFPPGSESRIPVVAVTGTNGKTTTTRLIAHLLRQTGKRVGFTTTDGVYYQDRVLLEGDMTGPMAADMVLSHPRVDAAVLETARGGILRAGLGFDACDAAVVLNVTEDHLGLRGIHTVQQLADVKGVLVTAVRPGGHAVLNADDPLVYAMRERAPAGAGLALFSIGAVADSAPLSAHVVAGGKAVAVENGVLVLCLDGRRRPVLPIAEVPLTAGGAARFQAQNVAAATAAAWALGVPAETIRRALETFVPSPTTTPGRMNVLRVGGATVVVDYAHNVAAVAALIDYAERVRAKRRIGVFSSPGDRRDGDVRAIGALAAGLDALVLKEHPRYLRGRRPGELAGVMREGFVAAGGDPARTVVALDDEQAVAAVRSMLRDGDLVLFVADDAAKVIAALEGAGAALGTTTANGGRG